MNKRNPKFRYVTGQSDRFDCISTEKRQRKRANSQERQPSETEQYQAFCQQKIFQHQYFSNSTQKEQHSVGSPFKTYTRQELAQQATLALNQFYLLKQQLQGKKEPEKPNSNSHHQLQGMDKSEKALMEQYRYKNTVYGIRPQKKANQISFIMYQCMTQNQFTSASEIREFIRMNYDKDYTVAEIMQQYRSQNYKNMQQVIADAKKIAVRPNQLFYIPNYMTYEFFVENTSQVLFYAQVEYASTDFKEIFILLLCGKKGATHLILKKSDIPSHNEMNQLLQAYFEKYGQIQKVNLVLTPEDHFKNFDRDQKSLKIQRGVSMAMHKYNATVYCLLSGQQSWSLGKQFLTTVLYQQLNKKWLTSVQIEMRIEQLASYGYSKELFSKLRVNGLFPQQNVSQPIKLQLSNERQPL